jgi:hypothetical protein
VLTDRRLVLIAGIVAVLLNLILPQEEAEVDDIIMHNEDEDVEAGKEGSQSADEKPEGKNESI